MASFSLQPGGLVGERYRLRQMIGAGGMGAVWSARDEAQGRDVAVKFLHPSLLRDPMAVQRFFQEAEAGTQLRHANIIETYASGRHVPPDGKDPIPYLVMELLDGEPLTETMQRLGPLWLGAALVLMRDVARAADAAHRGSSTATSSPPTSSCTAARTARSPRRCSTSEFRSSSIPRSTWASRRPACSSVRPRT